MVDKIKFGNSDLKDTLIARKNGLYFSLEEPWRIEEGTMAYKYGPKATFQVLNKTDGGMGIHLRPYSQLASLMIE